MIFLSRIFMLFNFFCVFKENRHIRAQPWPSPHGAENHSKGLNSGLVRGYSPLTIHSNGFLHAPQVRRCFHLDFTGVEEGFTPNSLKAMRSRIGLCSLKIEKKVESLAEVKEPSVFGEAVSKKVSFILIRFFFSLLSSPVSEWSLLKVSK